MRGISEIQIRTRLETENPWWASGDVQEGLRKLTPRPYLDLFYPFVEKSEVNRAVVLMGPRRVGKTVMIHHAVSRLIASGVSPRRICYISVDHPIYTGLDLDSFVKLYRTTAQPEDGSLQYVFFDEIQYLRDWEKYLKAIVDSQQNVQIVASGSAAAALRMQSTESGAGRFTDFFLPPLTFYEFLVLVGRPDLVDTDRDEEADGYFASSDLEALNAHFVDYINFGGYPEVVLSSAIREDMARFIKSDIVDKVLLRDLPSLYGIRDIQELNYLFSTLAFNTAQEVSLEGLSQNSGVAKNTIKRYIEYLEAAFLIKIIHRVDQNAKRFRRQNYFKVYLANPSMRSALFAPIIESDEAAGDLVETAAFSQWFHEPHTPLYYARWKAGELDLVCLDARQQVAWVTEFKWTDRFADRPEECDRYVDFALQNGLDRVVITSKTKRRSVRRRGIELLFIPASVYCFSVGYNVIPGRQRANMIPIASNAED